MALVDLAVIALLILVNALYVAAEFSAVGVRRSRIRELADDGSRPARQLLPVLEDPQQLDRYIAACQIGITLSSLVLGAYGQATLATRLAPALEDLARLDARAAASTAAVGVLLALTTCQVIFGELVPKSVALQHPTETALYAVPAMRWSLRLFRGFIAVLNGSGVLLLRALGLARGGARHVHSPEEIELLIVESRDGGLLEPDEQVRLQRALRLRLRTARDLMVPRPYVAALDVDTPFERAVELVTQSPYTRLLAYGGSIDNVVGVVHTRDVVLRHLEGRRDPPGALVRPIPAAHEHMTADELLRLLRESRSAMAVVLDEFGSLAGLVTAEDILAELLGGVADEFKMEQEPERLPDGAVRLPGRLRLDEAEDWTGVRWEGDASTVGGLVTAVLGRVPAPGDRLVVADAVVEVEQVVRNAVTSVRVMRRREAPHG